VHRARPRAGRGDRADRAGVEHGCDGGRWAACAARHRAARGPGEGWLGRAGAAVAPTAAARAAHAPSLRRCGGCPPSPPGWMGHRRGEGAVSRRAGAGLGYRARLQQFGGAVRPTRGRTGAPGQRSTLMPVLSRTMRVRFRGFRAHWPPARPAARTRQADVALTGGAAAAPSLSVDTQTTPLCALFHAPKRGVEGLLARSPSSPAWAPPSS
jgi:hypothetical protein